MKTEFIRLFYSDDTQLNQGTGGDVISTDELSQVNGVLQTNIPKVQRTKTGFGSDGDLEDVRKERPLPVTNMELLELLKQILIEMKVQSYYLHVGLNVPDDPETVRSQTGIQ